MKETQTNGDLDGRVAESVRRALRLVGHAEGGIESDLAERPEETGVS